MNGRTTATSDSTRERTVRDIRRDDIPREDGIVYVDITMRAGRTEDQKKALYARLCQLAGEQAGVEPHNIFIVLHENRPSDWSFGYGEAQYLT